MAFTPLRLLAEDSDDLTIISAAAQDSIFQVNDATWHKATRRFTLRVQRYVWEIADTKKKGQRVWAVLSFEGVLGVRAQKVAQSRRDAFASLLSVSFAAGEAPSGIVTLHLADGGMIALDVECLDVLLADLGQTRDAVGTPNH